MGHCEPPSYTVELIDQWTCNLRGGCMSIGLIVYKKERKASLVP